MNVKLSLQSLQALRDLINGTPYRTGSNLIDFFNQFGWDENYSQGFPSRWYFTDQKLIALNDMGRISEVIEKALDPRNFLGTQYNVDEIVRGLNGYLQYDGVVIEKSGSFYRLKRLSSSQIIEPVKNIIFASIGSKPDIVLSDALTNKITIVGNSGSCLVYDREISENGLSWQELLNWWAEKQSRSVDFQLTKELADRLISSVPDTSPPARNLLLTYYNSYYSDSSDFPALLPEVYLHYDPKTVRERGSFEILKRQRMDFLMLLPKNVRIVIEVDGKQHYSRNGIADPQLYADLVRGDRELQLLGYEVYRFGGYELQDTNAKDLVEEFFTKLFKKYL
jgi:hypothetical protein